MTAIRVISPSGSNGSIQFKTGGEFNGDAAFTFVPATKRLTLLGTGSFSALSGSLTQLENGDPYLHAGANITLATGSDGSVTITSSGGGGGGIGEDTFRCFSRASMTRYQGSHAASNLRIPDDDEARARRAFAPWTVELERLVSARVAIDGPEAHLL